ncbi:hypothetical protein A3B40_00935 [Candidatus Roizmanbacteria bacterium RIFCSPLOWO2_01_FULL_37_16]|uniref:Glycosyltransferase 2-like domain-containing protein n=1 Tax=Candidatus Roizmanbacteria bacterium RIFCSPLOWO2_01_FULL_37_16 TaxID=1802058 RepID=A0A1F7IJ66_9BACT|nr:MAG: hypothetical protein A3B40_00935 [Candidatus Roizmanbacteria bacterium RIFCSPLOWO2_01_FULL_37_16]
MKNQKKTISIGISVYNEVGNIENLLYSIIRQDKTEFNLEAIYVICDGTNDGTDILVEKLAQKFSIIRLLNDGKRKGKIRRLSELFKLNLSDVLMILDGDVVLGKSNTINEVVKCFEKKGVFLVSANNQPVKGDTLVGKIINYSIYIWYFVRLSFNYGDNIYNARNCCIALRKEFVSKINFPPQIHSYGRYLYLLCQQEKQKFVFAKNALILYRKPNNIREYIMQTRGPFSDKEKFEEIFGNWIKNKYKIPLKYKLLAILNTFTQNPFLFISSVTLKFIIKQFPFRSISSKNSAVWETVISTKKPISVPF